MTTAGLRLVDTHVHLDVAEFDGDREEVLQRAREAGVAHQIVPAIDAAGWPRLRDICADAPDLHAAYGLHPMFLAQHENAHLDALRDWVAQERPVAIGECGLDYFVEGRDPERQRTLFDAQLRIAREADLPVIVHARRAVDDVIAAIRRIGGLRGIVHSFSGSRQQAETLWRHGFLIGLGGPVTYPRAQRLRELASTMPLEFLVLETDAPDQPDVCHRGVRNEPARIVRVLETIAELRGADAADIARATTANATTLFGLRPASA